MSQDSDERLVINATNGDRTAFDSLIQRYKERVVKVVMRYTTNLAEVDDITQEVFMRAYRAIHQYRGGSRFYTWLYSIAVNTAKKHWQQTQRLMLESLSLDETLAQLTTTKLKELTSPENLLESDQVEVALHSLIEQLPTELQKALFLREVEGLSYQAIADLMQCPLGTIRSRLYRAREQLEQQLKPLVSVE